MNDHTCKYCQTPTATGEYNCRGCGAPVNPPPPLSVTVTHNHHTHIYNETVDEDCKEQYPKDQSFDTGLISIIILVIILIFAFPLVELVFDLIWISAKFFFSLFVMLLG